MSFSVTSLLNASTSAAYLAKTIANLLCALTSASNASSSAVFLCLHDSAKHMSWGDST